MRFGTYCKTCLKGPLKNKTKKLVFNTNYCLMQVKSIAECSTGFKAFVLPIFEWPLKTGFTVLHRSKIMLYVCMHSYLLVEFLTECSSSSIL